MGKKLREYAIATIREGLAKLCDGSVGLFHRMYPDPLESYTNAKLYIMLNQIEQSLCKPHLLKEDDDGQA